jgi:hypothetical protein
MKQLQAWQIRQQMIQINAQLEPPSSRLRERRSTGIKWKDTYPYSIPTESTQKEEQPKHKEED